MDAPNCPVCYKEFIEPKILSCGHSLCIDCTQDLILGNCGSSQLKCPWPNCKKVTILPSDGLPTNIELQYLMNKLKKCDFCWKCGEKFCDGFRCRLGKGKILRSDNATECMQNDAKQIALEAIKSEITARDVSRHITNGMGVRYGGVWECMVINDPTEHSYGASLKPNAYGHFITLALAKLHIVLFKMRQY